MPGYITYRTTAPALVRLARTRAAVNAGFLILFLATGFAVDRLLDILFTVLEKFCA